ncbi:Clan CD, family C14, metacaspase-like cysteine peptidase [Histomonas meleagridis]|uniref:Clan CD, family C14, metacaspase-like cysteine peptidase n=1 Tax=Histomonas meleagridis TaxID=135588 RepID=UPI00355A0FAB|nr:Clan CD, family C14, metacaspase-like cysteine peptidase [Histomonas meleagridis]KAH0803027.1 Clan CD, family C14, metacaspase-like cysteine peptidase [Histomonas meleagridis]
MSDPVTRLRTYGRDLGSIPISRLPTEFDKACFICVNTYQSYRLNLGTGPLNDAVSLAKCVKNFGFHIYFLHNPHSRNFLKYLDHFFQFTTDHLVFFYVGHGTTVRDLDGDEDDGNDEAFVFDDGNIVDDELIDHLINNKNPNNRITLITDACHSGSIWDIQGGDVNGRELPDKIISISAANDRQTAKQTVIERQDQGVFTYNLTKTIKSNPTITPKELKTAMTKSLRKYAQTFTVATTSNELLDMPLFE